MSIVVDPDNLDRFQVCVDPVAEIISIRGLGTERHAVDETGDSAGTTTFTDAGANFTGDGVTAGDILTIISDPGNDGGIIGHYVVQGSVTGTTFVVDRAIPASTAADLTYKINAPEAQGGTPEAVADGVTMQALYSFLKEEWRTYGSDGMGAGLGNAEDLIKYTFPIVSITREQFEIGGVNNSNWDFADDSGDGALADESPRNLIRTGGWASINSDGVTISHYPGIITLGSVDTDAQVYYQLTSATTNPTDFVLTGPVNQSIQTLQVTGGVTAGTKTPANEVTGDLDFTTTSAVRDGSGGNWITNGYAVGDKIQIVLASDSNNNGIFEITNISNDLATNDLITVQGTPFTVSLNDATGKASPMTDNRDYLVLRVRKKARSYDQSEIADIGVTTIETIVNRFPLSHATDPAILLDDGAINGDGTNTAFQSSTTVESGTDGVTSDPVSGDGLFTFTSASATWNTGGEGSQLYPGDTIEFTDQNMVGVYQVDSVTSDTVVVLREEPGRTFSADTTVDYTARSRVRVAEATDGSTADSATEGQGTFTSAGSTFSSDGVVAGDILRIKSGTAAVEGVYKVVSVTSETVLEIETANVADGQSLEGDQDNWPGESSLTFDVLRAGMHLQFKSVDSTSATAGVDITSLIFGSGTNTIQLDDPANEDWRADYDYQIGGTVVISGANTSAHNGTYIITGFSTTSTTNDTISVINSDGTAVTFSADTDTGVSVAGEYGFVRELNGVQYSFNWRLFGNGGTLAESFQFLQRELRQTTDIDEGDGSARGDITDLLMNFIAPNGTTLNLFIDDLNASDLNNATQRDVTNTGRNFAFISSITINLNDNITSGALNKVVVFFTDPTGGADDEFGTPGAIIVQDKDAANMEATDQTTTPLSFSFDYTNNAQGGRTPDTDANVTIVAITTDTGQYVSTTGTIQKVNNNVFSLVAGLERNYSNP